MEQQRLDNQGATEEPAVKQSLTMQVLVAVYHKEAMRAPSTFYLFINLFIFNFFFLVLFYSTL